MKNKMHSVLSTTEGRFDEFMQWIPDDRLSVSRFIQHGASMIGNDDVATLDAVLPDLLERAAILASSQPREAACLECLIRAYAAGAGALPASVRREVAFALLYCEKFESVRPEYAEVVGLLEGRAVLEIVFLRNIKALGPMASRVNMKLRSLAPSRGRAFIGELQPV